MPRTPQKLAFPVNVADQAMQTIAEHTILHPADYEVFFAEFDTSPAN